MASTAWMQRARRHWQRPTTRVSLAAVPLTIAAIYLLGRSGVVSEVPLWALLLVLPAASIQSQVFRLRWDVEPSTARMHQLIASNTVGTGVVMYMTGWGPALAFAFALTAHDVISDAGSKAWRPALAWSLVAMACGEAAIWGGLAPTMIGRPEVDGLAALSALGLSFILAALGLNAARAEAAEESLRESEESFRLLFARNPQPMWLFDVETLTIVEVNEAAIDHYGYTGDQFRSMTITDLRPEEDRLAVVDAVGRRTEGVRHAG